MIRKEMKTNKMIEKEEVYRKDMIARTTMLCILYIEVPRQSEIHKGNDMPSPADGKTRRQLLYLA